MPADAVHAEDQPERRTAATPHEHQPSGFGLDHGALTAPPAATGRLPPLLHLLTRAPVAPDALELAARGDVVLARRCLRFERRDFGLQLADALHVLVLAERRLHAT